MVDPQVALWDVAPMPIILAEAGGRFSAWDGVTDPARGSGVASNGIIHDELLAPAERLMPPGQRRPEPTTAQATTVVACRATRHDLRPSMATR